MKQYFIKFWQRITLSRTLKQINFCLLIVVIAAAFLEGSIPWMRYISIFGLTGIYVLNLIAEKKKKGNCHTISIILFIMTIGWVIVRGSINSKYLALFGQIIMQSYQLYSQWQILGRLDKSFLRISALSILTSILALKFPSMLAGLIVLFMQILVILRFLDPILHSIAMAHRAKRLEQEEKIVESKEI